MPINNPYLYYRIKYVFNKLKGFLFSNIVYIILACLLFWNYFGKEFLYKRMYGMPIEANLEVWQTESNNEYIDENPKEYIVVNGHKIKKTFVKEYEMVAMLGYHDDNTTWLKKNFTSLADGGPSAYHEIASDDLLIVWGETASPNNLANLKSEHELNLGILICQSRDCKVNYDEFINAHILPANKNVLKGVSILPKNKYVPIYIKGYLVDWSYEPEGISIVTARASAELSKQRAGGSMTGLCYQLYLTTLIYDGYVFE